MTELTLEYAISQIRGWEEKAKELIANQLPHYNVKFKGYKADSKELLAQVNGSLRLDHILKASEDKNTALQYLLDGRDNSERSNLIHSLGRVFMVIECGPKKNKEEPPEPIYA